MAYKKKNRNKSRIKESNKKTKKNYNFKKEFSESLNFIKEARYFIYSVIGVFVFFSLVGFFIPVPENIKQEIMKIIQELLAQTKGMSQPELIWFIFWNNLQSTFFAIVLGFIFGILPFFSAISNGYFVGFVAKTSVNAEGILSLWRLFPHGIFELPAVFIALGLGLKNASFLFKENKKEKFNEYLIKSLKSFFYVVFPLLVIAAVIEGSLIALFN